MKVAVIIPAYNAEATLAQCLEACRRQTRPADDIFVVDDGSTDSTPRIAESRGVHLLRQERQGPAAARNAGAKAAQAEIVVFTDSDCAPEPEWLERLLGGFTAPEVAGAGGSYGIVNKDSWLARMVHEEIAMRHDALGDEVDFLGSFNVAYRNDVFDRVGGFDESFRMASGEDNDLAYRIQDAGGTFRFVRDARVGHVHPERFWRYLRTQQWHGYWRMKLYRKHPHRASRGDKYAGIVDLAAPPASLILVLGWVLIGIAALTGYEFSWLTLALAGATVLYAGFHVSRAWRLASRSGKPEMIVFAGVAMARDLARAVGLVRGFLRFQILGRVNP